MLTDEAQIYSEMAMLKFDLEEMVDARQRDRRRLRAALESRRFYRRWATSAAEDAASTTLELLDGRRDLAERTEERGSFQEGAGVLEKTLQRTETDLLKSQVQLEEARRERDELAGKLAEARKAMQRKCGQMVDSGGQNPDGSWIEIWKPCEIVIELAAALRGGEGK